MSPDELKNIDHLVIYYSAYLNKIPADIDSMTVPVLINARQLTELIQELKKLKDSHDSITAANNLMRLQN